MIKIETEISLTGKEMADEFWELDEIEQASFFNLNKFEGGCGIIQMDSFVDHLDDNGINFIERIYKSLQGRKNIEKELYGVYASEQR